jgi:putative membrane protein
MTGTAPISDLWKMSMERIIMMNNLLNRVTMGPEWNGFCGNGFFRYGRGMHYGGWMMWIVVLILVAGLVFLLVRNGNIVKKRTDSPMDQLKRRYVDGEISKEEFLEKREFIDSL